MVIAYHDQHHEILLIRSSFVPVSARSLQVACAVRERGHAIAVFKAARAESDMRETHDDWGGLEGAHVVYPLMCDVLEADPDERDWALIASTFYADASTPDSALAARIARGVAAHAVGAVPGMIASSVDKNAQLDSHTCAVMLRAVVDAAHDEAAFDIVHDLLRRRVGVLGAFLPLRISACAATNIATGAGIAVAAAFATATFV
jgi:hypothetical protein